jgi:hypothetical protein
MNSSCRNRYAILVLLMIVGSILLLVNSKHIFSIPGILPVSVILMTAPLMIMVFSDKSTRSIKLVSLLLLFFPLLLINYIYFINIGFPVGFQDVHIHISVYTHFINNGKILFPDINSLSINFVGLYILSFFIEKICNINIVQIATIIPPFINIVITFIVYLLINRLFTHKIAILATMIFGWADAVLLFGHEFRTQTLGTLFLFGIILSIAFFYQKKETSSPRKIVILLLLFSALVTASFISFFYGLIVLICILITSRIFEYKWNNLISPIMVGLFCLFLLFYIMYIGFSFDTITTGLILQIKELFSPEMYSSPAFGQVIYGDFVRLFTYCFWGIFIICSIFYLKNIIMKKVNILRTSFFTSFSILFIFGILTSVVGELNPGRVYAVAMILMGTVVSFFIITSISRVKKRSYKSFLKIIAFIFIVLFISTSLAKFPNYIIGETKPIRGQTEIDKYNYWRHDNSIDAVSIFMKSTIYNKSLYLHMLIKNYLFLELYDQNLKPADDSVDYKGNLIYKNLEKNNIILLENKADGQDYADRNLLPPQISYEHFNSLYNNGDYILYGG